MELPVRWKRQDPDSSDTHTGVRISTVKSWRLSALGQTKLRRLSRGGKTLSSLSSPGYLAAAPPCSLSPYQEFPPLFPMAALGICAAMGLRGNVDQVPLFGSGLWSLLQ